MPVTKTFTPKAFAKENPQYTGTVSLRMPSYVERLAIMREVDACGDDNLARLEVMARRIPSHFAGADVIRLDDQRAFKTWDDFEYESGLSDVISELTVQLLGESRVGAAIT